MPIFDYGCRKCGEQFELLVRSETKIKCPACGGEELDKKFSLFYSRVAKGPAFVPPCRSDGPGCDPGRCGSGRCGAE
jgi:putative FmdB family regulatory protein